MINVENEEWKMLHNEELHSLYRSPNIVRVRWAGNVARMEKGRNAFKILTGIQTYSKETFGEALAYMGELY